MDVRQGAQRVLNNPISRTKTKFCLPCFGFLSFFLLLNLATQCCLADYFLERSIRNINYRKFKTKKNLNILILQKKNHKTKTETHKVL